MERRAMRWSARSNGIEWNKMEAEGLGATSQILVVRSSGGVDQTYILLVYTKY